MADVLFGALFTHVIPESILTDAASPYIYIQSTHMIVGGGRMLGRRERGDNVFQLWRHTHTHMHFRDDMHYLSTYPVSETYTHADRR